MIGDCKHCGARSYLDDQDRCAGCSDYANQVLARLREQEESARRTDPRA
jgi:ribosomal protein L37E